jgi:hypothetical protein
VLPNDEDSPYYKTCVGIGPNYYRTFDGLEFIFNGHCTYTLFNDGVVTVLVDLADCTLFSKCVKVGTSLTVLELPSCNRAHYAVQMTHSLTHIHIKTAFMTLALGT